MLSRFVTFCIKTADFRKVIFGEAYPKIGVRPLFSREVTIMKNIPDKYRITGEITLQFSYLDRQNLGQKLESS